jgi:hypothetical protein
MVKRVKHTVKKHLKLAGYTRWLRASVVLVLLASMAIPALSWLNDMKAYAISPDAERVIGTANKNLSVKFTFDPTNDKWQFNKNGAAALAANIAKQQGSNDPEGVAAALSQLTAKQAGGGGKNDTSLYSVDLPSKMKEGITYYDNVSKLSFKMVPSFTSRDSKLVQDRVVYPFMDGAQIIYTAKSTGLKEDIVLSKYISETVRYSYDLQLPETLQAKLLDDGSVGIYSGNPALYGNISFSSDQDKARVIEARKTSSKDNLVFSIPAPFIKDQTGKVGHTKYYLKDNRLTVVADGLKDLKYPLSVDPSVTITSASDFNTDSNEETNVDFGQTGDVKRGSITGGSIGSWTAQTSIPTSGTGACTGFDQVYGVHNGYIYIVCQGKSAYAQLSSTGTITGTWQTGTAPPAGVTNRSGFVYNGYMYLTGGTSAGAGVTSTYYIKLNSNGTMGSSWTATSTLTEARYNHGAVAYNGFAYVSGGQDSSTQRTSVEKAAINGDGSLGAWTTTGTTALTGTGRSQHQMEAYNGYMYVTGGTPTLHESVEFARINSDGTMGSWSSTTSIPTGANNPYREAGSGIHNGYWYMVGGCDGTCTATAAQKVIYAPVYANGQVGTWQQGTTLPAQETYPQFGVYNGYIFSFGGTNGNVYSSPIDPAGSISAFAATTDFDTNAKWGLTSVAAAGFIYTFAGQQSGGGYQNSARYARICDGIISGTINGIASGCSAGSANIGTVGTWYATNSFVDTRYAPTVETYGNSIYLIGGTYANTSAGTNCTTPFGTGSAWGCPDVQRAVINTSDGTLSWSGTYTYSGAFNGGVGGRSGLGSAIVNNYLYVIGGQIDNSGTPTDEVDMAAINADGTLGAFTTTLHLDTARRIFDAVSWNGHIYAVAGQQIRNTEVATINPSDGTITDWSTTGNDVSGGTGAGFGGHQVIAYNGYIYVVGGQGSANGFVATIQIARVNSDGSLGNWSASSNTFTSARNGLAAATYNGFLYVVGGCNNVLCPSAGLQKDVQYTRITNGGRGMTEASSNKGSFTTARAQAATATYNGYVYLTGGCSAATGIAGCTASTNDTRYAQVGLDGSLSWSALDSNVPTSRYGHTSVAYNGYLYVIGGCSSTGGTNGFCTTFLGDVQRIQLNSDGNTTGNSWGSAGSSLITPRYGLSATAYNGYMYVVGGCSTTSSGNCSTAEQTVEYAQINSNGSLGSWSATGGSGFTTGRFLQGAVAYGGKLYIAGGCSTMSSGDCTVMQNDVQYATINSNGTVDSTWNMVNRFATPRFGLSLIAQNGMMYITGGCSTTSGGACTTFQGDTLTASMSSSGALNTWWKQISAFTDPRYLHAGVLANGYLYLLGGTKTGPALLADSMGAALQLHSRSSQYSKLLTVSPTTDIASVYYNGSLGDGSSVRYKVAPSSGVFGGTSSATQGTGSEPTPLCGLGTIYYVEMMITLDDSTTAVFGDENISSVTDSTIYYRINATPPPNLRLNGGKWFYSETQQALDICKA